jgi:prepilin-type N-terminal cleavage/methylation domain-containing protein
MIRSLAPSARSGFTLLESLVSMVIFAVIGMALALASRAGENTELSVAGVSSENRSMRTISRALTDELSASCDTQITVTQVAGDNDTLRFLMPIQNGTTLGWGVYDRTLGPDEAAQNRAGWSVRYVVLSTTVAGKTTRRLVRQELDGALAVQRQKLVLDRVRSGSDTPPGFTVRKQGAMWEITLSADSPLPQGRGIQETFHVQARNQQ